MLKGLVLLLGMVVISHYNYWQMPLNLEMSAKTLPY